MASHYSRYTINHRSEADTKYQSHDEFHRQSVGVVEFRFTGEEIEFLSQLSRSCLKNNLYINSASKDLFTRIEEAYTNYCDYNLHNYKSRSIPMTPYKVVIFN